jgi:hypothetical protein
LIASVDPFSINVPLNVPLNVKLHVTRPPLPPPAQFSTVELFENEALITVLLSFDTNVNIPPAMVNVPAGFDTLLPPDNEPPEFVKPPWSAYANANGIKMARHEQARIFFTDYSSSLGSAIDYW